MIYRLIQKLSILVAVGLMFFSTSAAFAQQTCADCNSSAGCSTQEAIECGSDSATNNTQTPAQAATNVHDTFKSILNIVSLIVGALAIIMLMVGGIRFASSSGSQESVASARRTVLYAVAGLVIAAVAQVVVHFVLNNLNSATGG